MSKNRRSEIVEGGTEEPRRGELSSSTAGPISPPGLARRDLRGNEIERLHDRTCNCIRCAGFAAGNRAAHRHGAYARLELSPNAAETAETLRALIPAYQGSDEPLLQAFGYVLEQLKASAGALEHAQGRTERLRLSQDARGWTQAALRYADHFAMTPRARTALGLDLVRGEATRLTVTRLARLAEEES